MPRNEIRCFCTRKPLLAVYGRDESGELFIHVKVYKQSRIYAELFISADAMVKLRCRECLRLHSIKIVQGKPVLKEEKDAVEFVDGESDMSQVAGGDTTRVR